MFRDLAIDKKNGAMICFVGGGGKTSTMMALANYLVEYGSVLITTTTKIFMPSSGEVNNIIDLEKGDSIIPFSGITLLSGGTNQDNKVIGVDPGLLDKLYLDKIFKFILIEGDGAKNMAIKAPGEAEPIVPSLTDINIGIVGIEVIGKDLSKVCFRHELFRSNILDCTRVDSKAIAALVNNDKGIFKGTPKGCLKYFVLSKCDSKEEKNKAQDILKKIRCESKVNKTFISSIHNKEFIHDGENIAAVIMASGFSRRMGRNKLTMKINGISMIRRVALAATRSNLNKIVLVYRDDYVLDEIDDLPIALCKNTEAESGQSMSIKLGINSLNNNYRGYMFMVSDQPFLDSNIINAVINNFNAKDDYIALPYYGDKKGNPVIFPSYLREDLLSLSGDNGGKVVIEKCEKINKVFVKDEVKGIDVDTIEEFKLLGGKVDE
ncbi:MAG: selenium cofactor biosynthesis protein YqeC, partial [Clostridium sp.]